MNSYYELDPSLGAEKYVEKTDEIPTLGQLQSSTEGYSEGPE